ncbi:BglG family transcription antiterminator [Bacillus cereus]|uniref:BglG family transcription antiterminator n=1 Tax=Bacillus cereus TaxID=1396 RepID=UPI0014825643|nr:helix-turn-helix domain-containing protein [Bacillus cereus]
MEKDIYRKQQLITYLIQKTNWVTTQEIAQQLACSEKTIRKDIHQLSYILPEGWKIEAQKGKGIQLCKNDGASSQEVLSILAQSTLQFQILEHLFFHKTSTIVNLSEVLFVQPAMIMQQMKYIQQTIAPYELTLTSRPVQLSGHEWQIRMYYVQFFLDSYEPSQWPFEMYHQESLETHIQMIEGMLQIDFSFVAQKQLLYWIAISFYRIKNEGHATQTTSLFLSVKETSFFDKLQPFFKVIEQQENIILHEQEKIFFTLLIFSQSFTYRNVLEVRSMKLQRFYEKKLRSVQHIHDLLEQCKNEIGVNLFVHENIIFSLIEYFQKQALFLPFPPVFQRPSNQMEQYVQAQHESLFHQVKHIYEKWVQQNHFYPENNEIITMLTIYIQTAILLQQDNKVKVLYITSSGPAWQQYMYAQLQIKFGNQIQVMELETERITQEMVEQLQVQILITDIPTMLQVPAVITVETIFNARDWRNIERIISTVLHL